MKQEVITPPLLREASRKVVSKNSRGTSQFCILSNTLPVFAKNASHIDSSRPFQPFLILRFLRNRLSSYRRMASTAKKTGEELVDTDYDPEESESEAGTPKKGRKKKETPDPGLTMGADIEDHLKPDGKQVEMELSKVRIDQEKTKGQIRRKDAKQLQKRIESLEAAPQQAPYTSFSWKTAVCLQPTVRSCRCASPRTWTCLLFADGDYWCVSGQHSVKAVLKIGRSDRQHVCICTSGIPHARPIFLSLIHPGPSVRNLRDKHKEARKTLS